MSQIIIISHSGYGHTQKQADAVLEGAKKVPGVSVKAISIDAEGNVPDSAWDELAAAKGIIFGTPTYMGGPSWQFKKFADASSKPWMAGLWQDKIAAGFTNSGSINGDKHSSIAYLITLAMQHGMLWAGTGMKPANVLASQRNDVNWLGAFSGLMAQSPVDGTPEQGPLPGDLETARLFGKRVAELVSRLAKA